MTVATDARLAIHNTVLVTTLLYGNITWVLQKKNKCRGDLFVGYAESAKLIKCAMKNYTEFQILARISR